MKSKLIQLSVLVAAVFVFSGIVAAETSSPQSAPPLSFFAASYEMIGKDTISDKTYSGTVSMFEKKGKLMVRRNINGKTVTGEATIIKVIEDIAALEVKFTDNGKKMIATYQIDGDWENYPRLTGYLDIAGPPRKYAGIEALFYNEELTQSGEKTTK
jgi:hypothetical protein